MGHQKLFSMRDRSWLFGIFLTASSLALAYVIIQEKAVTHDVAADSVMTEATMASATTSLSPSAEPILIPVDSWEGTDIAGDIHLDGAGQIIPDETLHALFDYIRSAVGQIDTAQMRAHLLDAGRQHKLNAAQLAQLDGLFSKYLDYLQAVSNIQLASSDAESMRKVLEARHWMRRERLGFAMAEGFFSDSEAEDRYTLDRMVAMADKSLSAEQRMKRLTELSGEEPAARHAALQPSQTLFDLQSKTEQMRQSGASAEQIQTMRVEAVGVEAADRLKALDQEQATWTRRMQALEAARQDILSDLNIPADDKQRRINAIIERDFNGPDALRARAILDIAANPK